MTPPTESDGSRNAERRQSVSFSSHAELYYIPHHEEMSRSEKSDTWYLPNEVKQIAADMKHDVKCMRRSERRQQRREHDEDKEDEVDTTCCVGLEHLRSTTHVEQYRINKDCAIKSVLVQQKRIARRRKLPPPPRGAATTLLRDDDDDDDESLAKAARRGSEWARKQALKLGVSYAMKARQIRAEQVAASSLPMMETPATGSNSLYTVRLDAKPCSTSSPAVSQKGRDFTTLKRTRSNIASITNFDMAGLV